MNYWYDALKKSSLTPPAWVFGPIWTVLYTLMSISLIIYLRSNYTLYGLVLFGVQLVLNLVWSTLFFNKRLICTSALNNIVLNLLVFLTYQEFKKSSIIAANLLLPYMAWIALALYLNLYICLNN